MTRLTSAFATAVLASLAFNAQATELDLRVDTATSILQEFQRIPENAVPSALLSRAYAVAIIPSVIKAGFMVGGSYGRGIVVARRADGQWSNPAFVRLTGGSFGLQIGAQSTDVILVFKTQRALDGLSSGKITFGGNASVAAGPVGREVSAATDAQMQSEIYSYARSRGVFAGVSLDGAWMAMDAKANQSYYQGDFSAGKILTDTTIPAPTSGRRFIETLTAMTPPLQGQATTRAAAIDPDMTAPPPEGARTFGINEGAQPAAEGTF